MSTFTPGPWTAYRGDELVFVKRPNIAHIGVTNGKAYDAPFVVCGVPGPKGHEAADALLIAAAPDMLAALKVAVERLDALGEDGRTTAEEFALAQCRAAIAKAVQP